jgi:large subunit ribosomal protein L30
MAAKEACTKAVHKLHAVSLIKSGIRQPWWEKRTLKALGLTRLHKVVIHKNIPAVNGLLRSVKHLIDVKPVRLVEPETKSEEHSNTAGQGTPVFLKANGQFNYQKYQDFIASNPKVSGTRTNEKSETSQ